MRSRNLQWVLPLWAALSMAAFGGCGGGGDPRPGKEGEKDDEKKVRILALAADPEEVIEGESTTISWKVENAAKVELLEEGNETPLVTSALAEGEVEVTPRRSMLYALVATGEDGSHVAEDLAVEVIAVEPPRIAEFSAEPAEITLGETSTLRWEVANASSVEVLAGEDVLHEAGAAEDSLLVEPQSTTTYTLVARRDERETREELTIRVAPRIVRFEADPTVVTGDAENPGVSTFSWEVEGAEAVELLVRGEPWLTDLSVDSGRINVELPQSADFTLVAHGAGGTSSQADLEVQVVGFPRLTIIGPARVGAGDSFTLRWESEDAASVDVLKDGLPIEEGAPPSGELEQSLESTASYTFRAINAAGGSVEENHLVQVDAPTITTFAPTAWRVPVGGDVEVIWETLGAVQLELYDGEGNLLLDSDDPVANEAGSFRVEAPASAAYVAFELVARNGSGEFAVRTGVIVGDGPAIRRFEANPATITLGQPVDLIWELAADADEDLPSLQLTGPDGPIVLDGGSSVRVVPTAAGTQVYTLEAETALGEMSATATVEVLAAPTLHFSATPVEFDPARHDLITLEWSTIDAVSFKLTQTTAAGTETTLVETSNPARVAADSMTTSPMSLPLTFRAVATSSTGFEVEEVVVVDQASVELNFSASPTAVTGREPTTLSWDATGTASTYLDSVFVGGTLDPFIDISTDPNVQTPSIALYECFGDVLDRNDQGCIQFDFPDGFTFPFAGDPKTSARVYINGFISFDTTAHDSTNTAFYLDGRTDPKWNGFVHLSPFWNNLNRAPEGGSATGNIHYLLDSDADGRFLVIQWSHMWTEHTYTDDPTDLNFQVILREDGSFDYRYGTMLTSGSRVDRGKGTEASIGVRFGVGDAIQVFYKEIVPGGLEGFGLRFAAPELPASGSIEAIPLETTTYTLYSEDGAVSEDVTVTVTP